MGYKTFNESELRANFDGDEDILADLIEEFVSKYKLLIDELEVALNEKNFDKIKLSSHTLKGVVSNFFAEEIRVKFYEIEKNANAKKEENNVQIFSEIKMLMDELIKELIELRKTI